MSDRHAVQTASGIATNVNWKALLPSPSIVSRW